MATQFLTVIKIAGIAAVATDRLFRRWNSQRQCVDPQEWSPHQWPEDVRVDADHWVEALRNHAHQPPIVFFAEYVDLWSYSPPDRYLGEDGLVRIMANRHELYCRRLPFADPVLSALCQIRSKGQWDEDRLFAEITLRAASAWNELVGDSILVFIRRVMGSAVDDEEITQSLSTIPEWLPSE